MSVLNIRRTTGDSGPIARELRLPIAPALLLRAALPGVRPRFPGSGLRFPNGEPGEVNKYERQAAGPVGDCLHHRIDSRPVLLEIRLQLGDSRNVALRGPRPRRSAPIREVALTLIQFSDAAP